MSKKTCPIMSNDKQDLLCKESKCALWVIMYTTENISTSMCAFEAMAIKNSEGKIPV